MAALGKVNTSRRGPWVVGLLAFLLLFAGVGGWATHARLAGAVIAYGTVVVQGQAKQVQHLDGGIVSAVNVENGDHVQKGDIVLKLDAALLQSNFQIYKTRLVEGLARKARLVAERDGADVVAWQNETLAELSIAEDEDVKEGQRKLFEARNTALRGQMLQLREQVSQLGRQIQGVQAVRRSKQSSLAILVEELEGLTALKDKQLYSASAVMAREREREDLAGQIAGHTAEISQIRGRISEIELQILQVRRNALQEVLGELQTTELEIKEVIQQFHATRQQLQRVEIRAPVTGIVHELNVFTVGGVVTAGAQIMMIVPQDSEYEVEVDVEPQFVDDLFIGQPATVRFTAFNQRTTPELAGTVKTISASSITDQQTGQNFYRIRISVARSQLRRLEGKQLISGMPVETFIQTEERTPAEYLLKPLADHLSRAMKES